MYNKAIILVIDALRHDFVFFNKTGMDDVPQSYHNNMPYLTQLIDNSSASLFQVSTLK